jgi:hypothetical protein
METDLTEVFHCKIFDSEKKDIFKRILKFLGSTKSAYFCDIKIYHRQWVSSPVQMPMGSFSSGPSEASTNIQSMPKEHIDH